MKIPIVCLLTLTVLIPSAFAGDTIFVIGQDNQSIVYFMSELEDISPENEVRFPDGFMVYTAINDMRGLWDPVNQGAGLNYANQMLLAYPQWTTVQVGLYMKYMLRQVTEGGFDQNIDRLGQWIKNSHKQVYLRIGYEFDNPDNEYDPQEYIQAYRYIVDRLRARHIPNVHFVWHSIAWNDKNGPAYQPMKWYPGDGYVDWIGISFFDTTQDQDRNIIAAIARSKHKPLMVCESSPFKQDTVDAKLKWMQKLFEYVRNNHVKFLSYINVNWDALPLFAQQKWGDARLENNPVLMQKWLKETKQF